MAGGHVSGLQIRPAGIGRKIGPEIGLTQCHLGDDRDITLSQAWQLLSADEATRAQRFHFDRDRTRFVRARGFLRQMLGQACGQDPAGLMFGTGAHGKPFLQNCPLAFNLSHSRDLAVLALSQAGPVGIDIEFIDRQIDLAGLMQSCLTAAEADVVTALPDVARAARFFAFWTAKEARMKLTGEGMVLAPASIALDLVAGLPVGYLRPDAPAAQAVFVDLGDPGVLCCLAVAQGAVPSVTVVKQGAAHVTD